MSGYIKSGSTSKNRTFYCLKTVNNINFNLLETVKDAFKSQLCMKSYSSTYALVNFHQMGLIKEMKARKLI